MASADIVFEIASHREPIEVSGGVFVALRGSHVCHLFMGDLDNFGSYVVSLVCRFIRNIWTISIVIFPPFDQNSIIENPIRVVTVLADNFEEGIRLGSDSNAVVPLPFEVAGKLKGANIKCSGWFIREWILIVHRGVWSW